MGKVSLVQAELLFSKDFGNCTTPYPLHPTQTLDFSFHCLSPNKRGMSPLSPPTSQMR